MKLTVRLCGQWLCVPCTGTETVGWLAAAALARQDTLSAAGHGPGHQLHQHKPGESHRVRQVRRARCPGAVSLEDKIKDVFDDHDFAVIMMDDESYADGTSEFPFIVDCAKYAEQIKKPTTYIELDGNSLQCEDLMRLAKRQVLIKLTKEATEKVEKSRHMLDDIVAENKVVYGVTTGFGNFARIAIEKEKLAELQVNLIRSHSAGVGPSLSPTRIRALLALRINVLAKGYSGISLRTLHQYIDAFNASCLPWVPEQGTVGASGDLAPMSHLALGMMGEGMMWSPESGWADAKYVLEAHGLTPIKLGPKEGLALINGTQMITALAVEALEQADALVRQADIVAAMTLEVLKGTTRAFDADVHQVRPHKGQGLVAHRIRSVLHSDIFPSQISESHRFCGKVQDAYTLRCTPQVHGVVNDTIEFVRSILSVEINSATDNPMVFLERGEIISGGNFHGEYPAKAADYLAIGVHELASMSGGRIERLVNPAYSGLPAFLVEKGGLNSGFMIAQCTAAALVSENKGLCHPSSVDSITTSAGTEDHVSMGGWAARKAVKVVENVERVIAIELLSACQAIEFLRPLKTTAPLEEVYKLVRSAVGPWTQDRFMAPDIETVTKMLQEEKIWHAVKPYLAEYDEKVKHSEHQSNILDFECMSPTASYHPSILDRAEAASSANGTGEPASKRRRGSLRVKTGATKH